MTTPHSQPDCDAVRLATIEECAKIADSRAVKLRAKAKAQALPSRQWYFAQAIEARVIADLIRACRTSQLSRPECGGGNG